MSLNFSKLSIWQQQLFATALLQRMLPNYDFFSQPTAFGDYALLVNQLDLIWQKLAKYPIKINTENQLEKLEPLIPDEENFDVYAVYPAIDVCSGLVCLLQAIDESDPQCARQLSRLSLSCVSAYLEFSLNESDADFLQQQELMQWELETQQQLFEFVFETIENKQSCIEFKKQLQAERVTNLGFEY